MNAIVESAPTTINEILGKRLRKFRKTKGLMAKQMAYSLGMGRASYTCRETGRTTINSHDLIKIKDVFGDFNVDAFLNGGMYD